MSARNFPVEGRLGEIIPGENWGIVPFSIYKYQKALGLSIQEVYVLNWLFIHRWDGRETYPSINALVRHSGYTRPYIQGILREIEEKNLIHTSDSTARTRTLTTQT